jgi:hypothetical protein
LPNKPAAPAARKDNMSKTSICGDVREWSNWWRDRKKSDAHPKRDPAALLKSLPPEELVDVALATLNTLEAVEAYSYALHLMQTHLEHEGRLTLGWCVSLASKSGAFNKWEKTLGGYAPDVGPHGEYLIFECWAPRLRKSTCPRQRAKITISTPLSWL